MLEELPIAKAQRLTAPAPFALLSTKKEDGSVNLMAISWWTYLSNHPPMLGVCLSKKGLSGSRIHENGEFGLSIVSEDLKEAAFRCGICSGRAVDKVNDFSIPLTDPVNISVPLVAGSRVMFECRLVDEAEAGDHIIYIAEIVGIRGDESVRQLFAWDGYARVDPV